MLPGAPAMVKLEKCQQSHKLSDKSSVLPGSTKSTEAVYVAQQHVLSGNLTDKSQTVKQNEPQRTTRLAALSELTKVTNSYQAAKATRVGQDDSTAWADRHILSNKVATVA